MPLSCDVPPCTRCQRLAPPQRAPGARELSLVRGRAGDVALASTFVADGAGAANQKGGAPAPAPAWVGGHRDPRGRNRLSGGWASLGPTPAAPALPSHSLAEPHFSGAPALVPDVQEKLRGEPSRRAREGLGAVTLGRPLGGRASSVGWRCPARFVAPVPVRARGLLTAWPVSWPCPK
jgi:hypothetical protein